MTLLLRQVQILSFNPNTAHAAKNMIMIMFHNVTQLSAMAFFSLGIQSKLFLSNGLCLWHTSNKKMASLDVSSCHFSNSFTNKLSMEGLIAAMFYILLFAPSVKELQTTCGLCPLSIYRWLSNIMSNPDSKWLSNAMSYPNFSGCEFGQITNRHHF